MSTNSMISTSAVTLGASLMLAVAGSGEVPVNLQWRPATQVVATARTVRVALYAVSADPEQAQSIAAADVIVQWDPARLELVGVEDPPVPDWLFSGFASDPYGLNEAFPPADGDAMYTVLAPLGEQVLAPPEGLLLTTFVFHTTEQTGVAIVHIAASAGDPPGQTRVFSGDTPNTVITGTLGDATVEIVCATCPGDLTGDDLVALDDLVVLLAHYGMNDGAGPDDGDFDCDGDVDAADLAILLMRYGQWCSDG